jgi:hypothetical protein
MWLREAEEPSVSKGSTMTKPRQTLNCFEDVGMLGVKECMLVSRSWKRQRNSFTP